MALKVSLVWCWTGADWTTTKIGIINLGLEQKRFFFWASNLQTLLIRRFIFFKSELTLRPAARPVWHRPRTEHLQLFLRSRRRRDAARGPSTQSALLILPWRPCRVRLAFFVPVRCPTPV